MILLIKRRFIVKEGRDFIYERLCGRTLPLEKI